MPASSALARRGDDAERAHDVVRLGPAPALPDGGQRERLSALHGDGVGLLRPLARDLGPLEEIVDRQQAAPLGVGRAEHRRRGHALGGGVDGLELRRRLLDPVRDEPPPQPVEMALARLGVLADDPVLLARRAVVARRRVVRVQRLDQRRDPEAQDLGIALLRDASAHGATHVAGGAEGSKPAAHLRRRRGRAPTLAMPLFKLRIAAAGLEAGGAAAHLLTELSAPRALAVTLFESGPSAFLVEAYYDTLPALEAIAQALSRCKAASARRCWKRCPTRTGWRCRRRPCRRLPPAASWCTGATTAPAWDRGARPSRSRPARPSARATMPPPRSASKPSIG